MTSSLDMIRGRSNVVTLTNKSGGALVAGDVCVIDTANDESATTTTSAASLLKVYIAAESIANDATGKFYSGGFCPLVTPSASTTRGRYLFTHTVAKQAAENATYGSGAFGVILKSGTTPSAWLFGSTAQVGAAGVARSGATTDGHLAVWNGSSADSIKDGGVLSSGALVLLEQHAGAGVTTPTLNFTTAISATYDEYQIEIVNVVPATNGTVLQMLMSTDGGANYDTTGIYAFASYRWVSSGAAAGGNTGQAAMDVTNATDTISNSGSWGVNGSLRLYSPGSASLYKRVSGQLAYLTAAATKGSLVMTGTYESATAVNAFQFKFSSGDVASGNIRIYGVAK